MTHETELGVKPAASRRFIDCVGVEWTVYCITPPTLLDRAVTLLPHAERRHGWLFFESAEGDRRRLAPFPQDWREVSVFELERWCMRALPIETLPTRRTEDEQSV